MHGINKVMLIGNVGKDPKTKRLDNGVLIATFPFATSEKRRTRDGQIVTQTEWHTIVLWRGLAQFAERKIRKGDPLYIEGKLHTRMLRDPNGNTRRVTEIVASNIVILAPRRRRRLEQEMAEQADAQFQDDVQLDDNQTVNE